MADIIKLHDLRPAEGANKAKTRVGRGEASKGKTAGRGTKGTKARKNVPAAFEGGQMPIHMRLPKLKGFTNRNRIEYQIVNVGDIARLFPQATHDDRQARAAALALRHAFYRRETRDIRCDALQTLLPSRRLTRGKALKRRYTHTHIRVLRGRLCHLAAQPT